MEKLEERNKKPRRKLRVLAGTLVQVVVQVVVHLDRGTVCVIVTVGLLLLSWVADK